jgi:hypothetical protein
MLLKNKTVFILFILLLFFNTPLEAQWVKFIKNPLQAKYRVYITLKKEEANQWIFKVKNPTDIRKAAEWYIVENPQLFANAMKLFKTVRKENADFVVYYVSTRDSAQIRPPKY